MRGKAILNSFLLRFTMKNIFREDNLWAKVREKKHLIDILYGVRDNTNNHGHRVISGSEAIYDRQVSGAILKISGSGLFLNGEIIHAL